MSTVTRASVSDVTRGLKGQGMVWVAVGAILADRAVTLPYMHLESNPAVTAMGPVPWLVMTAVIVTSLIVAWQRWHLWQSRTGKALVGAITAMHALTAVTNALVITGAL